MISKILKNYLILNRTDLIKLSEETKIPFQKLSSLKNGSAELSLDEVVLLSKALTIDLKTLGF